MTNMREWLVGFVAAAAVMMVGVTAEAVTVSVRPEKILYAPGEKASAVVTIKDAEKSGTVTVRVMTNSSSPGAGA